MPVPSNLSVRKFPSPTHLVPATALYTQLKPAWARDTGIRVPGAVGARLYRIPLGWSFQVGPLRTLTHKAVTAALEIGSPVSSIRWRHHPLPALFPGASMGTCAQDTLPQVAGLWQGEHTLWLLRAEPKDRQFSDKTPISGQPCGTTQNKTGFQPKYENVPRTGLSL